MTATGGATGNLYGLIGNLVSGPGAQAPGTVVGQETPEWEFPYGQNRVADDVLGNFFRVDAGPTGLNEFLRQNMQSNPAVVSRFRDYVRMGIIRPKNQAAQNIVTGYGGYQAGDMTPLGPMINGMPSGLDNQQLATLANVIQSGVQYNLGLLDQMGYFDGVPTLEREDTMGKLAQGWMQQAISQFQQAEVQRHNMVGEDIDQQKVINDNIQKMADLFGGQMTTDPATGQSTFQPTEKARQFNTEQSGYLDGQATLTREQQAFNQAKDVANLMSNPRNYIEAQMLANARGGLGGMAPTNQVQQTTFGPATTTGQMPQFGVPGGQFNQLQTLPTMQGVAQPAAGQAGQAFAVPNPQTAAQPPPAGTAGQQAPVTTANGAGTFNLNTPGTWGNMLGAAGQQWGVAQQGLSGATANPAWQGLMPMSSTPTQTRPNYPQFGAPGAATQHLPGGQMPWQMGNRGQDVAGANGPGQQFATSNFTQSLLQNRVVPRTGGLSTPGQYMTAGQIQGAFNPNRVRTQDYNRGTFSQQQGFNAVGSLAGYSDQDLESIRKSNLPSFTAPGSGKMI